ncbi:uncharacterized protein LOC112175836 isoform X2 [Rosa chinensis]|uniref:uncharacterized protein LOC112175836 isoform X2 n=1 Tax=Rosa chinensis TaxID=74649 RepID=UPI001AD9083A|nr:uncharacterized protein LOC112175836 isoform X2 [Rosa chinensis]
MASTPVGSNALILEVLDRSNYEHWRSRLKSYLLAEDLWEAVEAIVEPPKLEDDQTDYKAWTKKNAKALYAIQNTCGRELFSFISKIETAKSAWDALEQECKVMQGYDENNADHLVRYKSFIESVSSGDWDKAKKCLGEVDMRSVVVVRAVDGDEEIALHVAAKEGHVHIVRKLVHLMTDEDLKTKTARGRRTALHVAAWKGHVHVVKELPVPLMGEVQDREGDTALHIAVQEGKVDIVKELVLLMRQEDLKIKNDAGYTALHLAVNKGNVPMVKEFVRKEKGESSIDNDNFEHYIPFITCVISGDWDQANECLKELDDPCGAVTAVDPRNNLRNTALHVAAQKGHVDVTKGLLLLLKMRQEDLELKTTEDFTNFGSGITLGISEEFLMERAKYMVEQYEKTLGSCLEMQNAKGFTALHLAILQGNGNIVKELVPLMKKEGLEIKDANGKTALNIAISKRHVDIAKELLQSMRPEALEEKDNQGFTALSLAVQCFKDGEVCEMAKYMAEKDDKVFGIPSPGGDDIPVVRAFRGGKRKLARSIYSVTPLEALKGPNGSLVICLCLDASNTIGIYIREVVHVNIPDISIHVAESIEDHSNERDFISSVMSLYRRFAESPYIFCGIHGIYQMKSTHKWIFQFLHCMGEATRIYNLTADQLDMVKKSIFTAIEQGHHEFVTQLCEVNPKLLWDTCDESGMTIFHFAIRYRQEEVFNLIYGLEEEKQNDIGIRLVNSDKSMLHFAADLFLVPYLDHIQDASLQMQRELQWFKKVESVVPPEMHEYRNRFDGLTARELFTKNHKKLIEDAENSTKGTATSCTVVGALIITMMFAAAFTVPGGNDGNTGLPLFLDHKLFNVFIVSDTISLVSSTSSVITFLGILTSRYAEDDFLKSLPTKMMIGLITLFFSISSMMIAFSCALIIMLDRKAWIITLSILFTSFPVILFVWSLFPLLIKIFLSTYRSGMFDKRKKKSNHDLNI